ncbi:MAG: RHS repeat-associated core domain-containing protein, partial [Pseudomonadota bacterium]
PHTVSYTYNSSNRLSSFRDTREGNAQQDLFYDDRGNTVRNGLFEYGGMEFTYDHANQPTGMQNSQTTGSFVYDGNYKRVKQTINGETIYSVYGASGQLMHRDNMTTGVQTDYFGVGDFTSVKATVSGEVTYMHLDHIGSALSASSRFGPMLWREVYTPFGELWDPPASANDNDIGFTGHIRDSDTGLTYMQARYYDPVIGRFLSPDPVGFAEGGVAHFNAYAYTANDPVNNIDPDGRLPIAIPIIVAACSANPGCRGAAGAVAGATVGGGASAINQATDGVDGFDVSRVAIDAGKGAITGGVSAATLNAQVGVATASILGGVDGATTAATDGNPETAVIGGAVNGAVTDGVSAAIGGQLGKVSPVSFPTGEVVGTIGGATVLPQVNQDLGNPAETVTNGAIDGAQKVGETVMSIPECASFSSGERC